MKKILVCIGLALMLSACGTDHVIRFNLIPQQSSDARPTYTGKSHFFLWGMWQKTDYGLVNMCPANGIKAIDVHWTFYDSLMGGLTMGIYAPESFSIYCN